MQISSDKLTKIASEHWAPTLGKQPKQGGKAKEPAAEAAKPVFSSELVASIYKDELGGGRDAPPALKRVMLLEVSQYLELYLWPYFDAATASFEHVMSILLMVNEKFRNGVPAWTCFKAKPVRGACTACACTAQHVCMCHSVCM